MPKTPDKADNLTHINNGGVSESRAPSRMTMPTPMSCAFASESLNTAQKHAFEPPAVWAKSP